MPHENCEEVEEQIPVEVCTSVDLTRHSSAYLFLINYLFISLHCFLQGADHFKACIWAARIPVRYESCISVCQCDEIVFFYDDPIPFRCTFE